jgi:hypothetical protein
MIMRRVLSSVLLLVLAGASPAAAQSDATEFDQVIATGSRVHMAITNYGFYGNNFFNRKASLEYPANRGFEHLVRGGLWVGARAQDDNGEFTGVTSGTVDAAQGPTSPQSTEFSPGAKRILLRSTLPNTNNSRDAVSELDLISDFNDLIPKIAANNSEPHRPLRIAIRHENYQWGFGLFQHCLFFHITLRNTGAVMESLWVGMYAEFASGYKDGYVTWPPSSGDAGGLGTWYDRKWVQYDDSLRLLREHYCAGGPAPEGCNMQIAPYWIGLRHLGSRGLVGDTTTRRITLSGWDWTPGKVDRDQDVERYGLMNAGTIQSFDVDSLSPAGPGGPDPVVVFSVGPFPVLPRDSTITVDFAIVGGPEVPDIQRHSRFAQFAYDNDYIVPVPPPSPRMHVVARDGAADVYWDKSSELAYDVTSLNRYDFEGYRVNIGEDPDTLARFAQFDSNVAPGDTAGFNTGFPVPSPQLPDSVTFGEQRCDSAGCYPIYYHYKQTIGALRNGFKYYVSVTAYDLGNSQVEPIESGFDQNRVVAIPGPAPSESRAQKPTVFPNPYRVEALWDQGKNVRDHYLWFTGLPERCRLKILTLSGDLVFEKDFDGSTYRGEGARGVFDPNQSLGKPVLSGTTFGWNMITTEGQAVATGLYLFTVEDKDGGDRTVGKFLIVKSDREAVR